MKNILIPAFIILCLTLFVVAPVRAQMVGSDAYLKGNYVEVGIRGQYGFEGIDKSVSPPPAGIHTLPSNPMFGFVANPQMNAWATYDGDFFTPGSMENGWGFQLDTLGDNFANNCAGLFGADHTVPGAITAFSYAAPLTTCVWEGNATSSTNLHFTIQYELHDSDLFYLTVITVQNNTGATIPEIYYYRNLDPDNNQESGGGFTTTQTIISQISTGGPNTRISATQALPWPSYFEFLAVDSNWVAGFGGFTNRNGYNMYYGASGLNITSGATNTADEAMYMAYKISNLAPAGTETFKFASIFDSTASGSAIAALNANTVSSNDINAVEERVSVYPNPMVESAFFSISGHAPAKNAQLQVFDMMGREVASVTGIHSSSFRLERNGLPAGLYLYRILDDSKLVGTGKLLIK